MSEGWTLDRRLAVADQRNERQTEVVIQALRLLTVPAVAAQLVLYPGHQGWAAYASLVVLLVTAAWTHLLLRADDRGRPLFAPFWTCLVGDVAVALLLMANYRERPGDAVQLLPLLMVVQGAARWGRNGGIVGGIVGGVVSSAWIYDVHERAGLDAPVAGLAFRVVIFALVGLFIGLMVRDARQQRRAAQAVFNASRDLVVTWDLDGTVLAVNPASELILGYPPEELIGQDRTVLLAPDERTFGPVDAELYRQQGAQLTELRVVHRDGHQVILEMDLLPDLEAGVIHAIGRDVSSRREAERELRRRVERDGLTGVRNREALLRDLDVALGRGGRPGLVFIDLDHFKAVNDRHGHLTGDRVLQEIAGRLEAAAGDDAVVARYAGDEFCLVVAAPDRLADVLARTREALAAPSGLAGLAAEVTASVGWAQARAGDDAETLLHRADQHMYEVKDDGRS